VSKALVRSSRIRLVYLLLCIFEKDVVKTSKRAWLVEMLD